MGRCRQRAQGNARSRRVQSIAIDDAIAEVPPSGKALNRGGRFEEVALRAIDSPKSEVVKQSGDEVDGGVPGLGRAASESRRARLGPC
jgi:hypothetical protein